MESDSFDAIVLGSSILMQIGNEASFGDALDIFKENAEAADPHSTINYTIDVRRSFEPANYALHVLQVDVTCKVAICCQQGISPLKIHQRLKASNCGEDFKPTNYLNRYDWMHWRNWGTIREQFNDLKDFVRVIKTCVLGIEDKPEQQPQPLQNESFDSDSEDEDAEFDKEEVVDGFSKLVFFVNASFVEEIKCGRFSVMRQNDFSFELYRESTNEPIGFVIESKNGSGFIEGDWHFGCLLVDETSKKPFAFVFGDYYTYRSCDEYPPDTSKLDIGKINFTFNKMEFKM